MLELPHRAEKLSLGGGNRQPACNMAPPNSPEAQKCIFIKAARATSLKVYKCFAYQPGWVPEE